MSPLAIALLSACLIWWAATGAILVAVRLGEQRRGTGPGALLATIPLLAIGLWAYAGSLDQQTPKDAYLGFLGALALWGWIELTFLTGLITGPAKTPCRPALPMGRRFWRAWGTIAHHELLLTAAPVLTIELARDAPNSIGLWTFAILKRTAFPI